MFGLSTNSLYAALRSYQFCRVSTEPQPSRLSRFTDRLLTLAKRAVSADSTLALKHRYGDTLRARTWFGQFQELILKATVRNLELAL